MSLRRSKLAAGGRGRRLAGRSSDCFESERGTIAASLDPLDGFGGGRLGVEAHRLLRLGAGFGVVRTRRTFRCSRTWEGCFETLAEALAAVSEQSARRTKAARPSNAMLPLVAEAQSALRAALKRLGASTIRTNWRFSNG